MYLLWFWLCISLYLLGVLIALRATVHALNFSQSTQNPYFTLPVRYRILTTIENPLSFTSIPFSINYVYINWQPFQPVLYFLLSLVTHFNEFKRRIVGYYMCPDTSHFCSSPFIPDVPFPSSNFLTVWVTFFSNSFGRSWLAFGTLSFPSLENVFISLSFLKDILWMNLELWIDSSFFSKTVFPLPSGRHGFNENPQSFESLLSYRWALHHFSVTAFKIFFLALVCL